MDRSRCRRPTAPRTSRSRTRGTAAGASWTRRRARGRSSCTCRRLTRRRFPLEPDRPCATPAPSRHGETPGAAVPAPATAVHTRAERRLHRLTRHLRDLRALRLAAAFVAVALAAAYLVAPGSVRDRFDVVFLGLLLAAALLALVEWERLTTFKAGQFELTIERPQVVGALEGLHLPHVADERLRSLLGRLEPQVRQIQGSRVLWIDDKPTEIVGERRLLRSLGIEVVPAASSEAAAEQLVRDNDFDAVISDVQRRGKSFEHVRPDVEERSRREVTEGGLRYAIVDKADGSQVVEIHEGVNFVAAWMRASPDAVIRRLPVVFYAAYDEERLRRWTALVPDAALSNSVEDLLRKLVSVLVDARLNPIATPPAKAPSRVD